METITTYELFRKYVIEQIDLGAKRISPMFIIELIRQDHHISISNNEAPQYRDQLVLENPQFSKFFLIRKESKGKHKKGVNFEFLAFIENLNCEVTSVTLKNDKGATYTLTKDQALRVAKTKRQSK